MLRHFLNSKIHRATVTDANLNYVGSITIDEEFLDGERFQTYAIKGARGSKCFCLNGAAARKAQPGDKIIIVTYAELTPEEIKTHKPTIVQVGEGNSIVRQ